MKIKNNTEKRKTASTICPKIKKNCKKFFHLVKKIFKIYHFLPNLLHFYSKFTMSCPNFSIFFQKNILKFCRRRLQMVRSRLDRRKNKLRETKLRKSNRTRRGDKTWFCPWSENFGREMMKKDMIRSFTFSSGLLLFWVGIAPVGINRQLVI